MLLENALFYILTPLLLHAAIRLFRGPGRFAQTLRIVSCAFSANMMAVIISPVLAIVRQHKLLEKGPDGDYHKSFFLVMIILFYMVYVYADRLMGAYYAGMAKEHGLGIAKSTLAGLVAMTLCVLIMAIVLMIV
ncbi:hypothetical protein K8S19_05950 [bacterium]|nr:hypothetical protein [bacterium]